MITRGDKITEWSALYDVDRETVAMMHSAEDSLRVFYNNQELIHKVFTRNSQLVQEFLAALPAPPRNTKSMGISIDFMFPTPAAYRELFEGGFHPKVKFEKMDGEIATWYWNADGTEFYAGPVQFGSVQSNARNPKIVLPTFVQTVGAWEKGFRHLVTKEMPRMIKRNFFVYTAAIGYVYDHRKRKLALGHNDVGVGGGSDGYLFSYSCSNGVYNPSSSVYEADLDSFWDKKTAEELEEKVQELDALFFKREERKHGF